MKTSWCTRITWWSIWWYRSIYLCWLILPMNDLLWNWVWGTDQDPNSGNIKNLIIDDYENNPNWKQNRYKTIQIGNLYTWRSWNNMFYKCYSLLPSLHHYFDGFTNEVPIVKMVVQRENLEHQLKHTNLLQKMLMQWSMDTNNLQK